MTDETEALRARVAALEARIAELEGKPTPAVSPLAPPGFPALPAVAGLRLAAVEAGVRYRGRLDLMLAVLAEGSVVAGTFTRSATRAAPVLWCQERLAALDQTDVPGGRAVIVNSGNANAFTGRSGAEAVERVAAETARIAGVPRDAVFMASTGVIGEPLAAERITARLEALRDGLAADRWHDAARAIMTTDTFPKGAGRTVLLDGVPVTIAGIAKGSGMIAPDMATMLVFVFTDCRIARGLLQRLVADCCDRTFNAITVDGDTSTSDTLLVGATGAAEMVPLTDPQDARFEPFAAALEAVFRDLALLVVRDGEGATKLAQIAVTGARTDAAARRIGLAIANSPLVKTALAGEDPNWGRIVMAVGKSGEAADRDRLAIRFGDISVAENGRISDSYREADGAAYMKRAELEIGVDVGVGDGRAVVWTCDLTRRYIEINADYRS